ncbi:MAG: hypothetical protein FWG51_05430 [Firmicutes bacterium]|nr:hypothetical protein [Bacillota bacterium]
MNRTNKAKVLQFNKDADFYLDMAEELIEKGKYINALTPIRRAVQIDGGEESRLRYAELYFLMEQYEMSALLYFKMLAKNHKLSDCYYGLGQNYYYLSNLEACLHNLNIFMTQNPDAEETYDAEDLINEFESSNFYEGYKLVHPIEECDFSETITSAQELITSGAYLEAIKIYNEIPQTSNLYILAQNSMAFCYIMLQNYMDANYISSKVLKLDDNNIFALCNLVITLHHLKMQSECDKNLIKLLNIETTSLSELFKIANTLCEIKRHESVYVYFNKMLTVKPYDLSILFLTAICCYNCKKFDEAKEHLRTILKIDENDYLAEYYLKFVTRVVKENDKSQNFEYLNYDFNLPLGIVIERIHRVNTLKLADKDYIKKQYETDNDFKNFLNWAFSYKPATAIETIKVLTSCGINLDDKISDILLSVKPNITLKKEIIAFKIFNQTETEIAYTFEGALKFLRPKFVSDFKLLPETFKSVYSLSYATLAFIADSFEVDFFKTFKKAREIFKEDEKLNIKALAAVITYKVSPKIFPQKKYLCKLFEVSVGEYNKYLKRME